MAVKTSFLELWKSSN